MDELDAAILEQRRKWAPASNVLDEYLSFLADPEHTNFAKGYIKEKTTPYDFKVLQTMPDVIKKLGSMPSPELFKLVDLVESDKIFASDVEKHVS
jgi:hypothetical protein